MTDYETDMWFTDDLDELGCLLSTGNSQKSNLTSCFESLIKSRSVSNEIVLNTWLAIQVISINLGAITRPLKPWWRHQMETVSALLSFCAGNSPVTGELPTQRLVTQSFDVFFDLQLKPQLGKQRRRRWFKTPSRPLWRYCNDNI